MKSKRILAIFITSILLLAMCTAPVVAYMIKKTGTITSEFKPAVVECTVNETFENNVKSLVTVTNNGNIDAYIRVRLVTYWVDDSGNVLANEPADIGFTLGDGWVKGADNTYYYKQKVAKDGSTTDLLGGTSITLKDGQVVTVLAEAVQADPEVAVKNAWGVTIENGVITGSSTN